MPRGLANYATTHAPHAHHPKSAPHARQDFTFTKLNASPPAPKHILATLCSINARNASLLATHAFQQNNASHVRWAFTLMVRALGTVRMGFMAIFRQCNSKSVRNRVQDVRVRICVLDVQLFQN